MKLKPLAASISVLMLAMSQASFAEEKTTKLDEITVKGELQERSLQDSATSAAVITGLELDQSTDSDVYDIIDRTPGVSSSTHKGFTIRGISGSGLGNSGAGQLINVTTDGVSLPSARSNIAGPFGVWDLEQVEVLRGPQSTQTGRNALAGAIHIRTANPTFEQETKIRTDFGTKNAYTFAVAHNQPLTDEFAIRLAAETRKQDGWVENPTLGDKKYDQRELTNRRIKLLFQPNDDLKVILGNSFTHNQGGEDFVDYNDWKDNKDRNNYSDYADAEDGAVSNVTHLDLSYQINDNWSLNSKTGHYDENYDRSEDNDNGPELVGYFDQRSDTESISQELKFAYKSDKLRAVFGVFYTGADEDVVNDIRDYPVTEYRDVLLPSMRTFVRPQVEAAIKAQIEQGVRAQVPGLTDEQVNATVEQQFAAGFSDEQLNTMTDQQSLALLQGAKVEIQTALKSEVTNKAIFGEVEYDISPEWMVVAGLRYDSETRDVNGFTNPTVTEKAGMPDLLVAGIIQNFSLQEASDSEFSVLLPKLGITHHLSDDIDLSFTYQKGYRAGGSGANPYFVRVYEYDPEYTDNYEFALRSAFNNGNTRFNANVFYTDWKDMQVQVFGPGGSLDYTTENAGSAELKGFELSLENDFSSNFSGFINTSYVQTELTDYTSDDTDYSGNEFTFAPKNMVSLGGEYYFDNNWMVSADANWQSEVYGDLENTDIYDISGRTIVNAKVGYEDKDWSAYLYSRNLMNQEYALSYLVENGTRTKVRTAEPRFIGLQINASF